MKETRTTTMATMVLWWWLFGCLSSAISKVGYLKLVMQEQKGVISKVGDLKTGDARAKAVNFKSG
jgi:hypothetical protein